MRLAYRPTFLLRALTCTALLLLSASSSSCAGNRDQHADCPEVGDPLGRGPKDAAMKAHEDEGSIAAAQKARPACAGFIEVKQGNSTTVLTSGCASWRPLEGPYGEILDPTGNTRVVIEACDKETLVDVVGSAKILPGTATNVRVRWVARSNGQEWVSANAELSVTDFGVVGGLIRGTFHATMTPKLNAAAEQITGSFGVCRGADRSPP